MKFMRELMTQQQVDVVEDTSSGRDEKAYAQFKKQLDVVLDKMESLARHFRQDSFFLKAAAASGAPASDTSALMKKFQELEDDLSDFEMTVGMNYGEQAD